MLYEPFKIKNLELKNRVVMPPMCMYSAKEDGLVQPFHIAHYTARAIGGVGLIIVEATGVQPNGRITENDLGIWSDDHVSGLKGLADAIKDNGSVAAIQLNHAGRKAKTADPVGPSAVSYGGDYDMPRALNDKEIKELVKAFKDGAKRALDAGFDMIELHAAHGYLLFQFLSPISNQRSDKYRDGKVLLREVVSAVRSVWPMEKALCIRVSADEYVEGGVTPDHISEAINYVKDLGVDLIDVSSGGNILVKIPAYPGYQLKLSKKVSKMTGLPVIGGGLITTLELAEYAVASNHADLVYLGRVLLRDPYFVINHAPEDYTYPKVYTRARKVI